MLSEGTEGSSLKQIDSVIGKYQPTKYTNSKNVSFANGFIVRDSFKNAVLSSYVDNLTNKYNAEVVFDSITSTVGLNKWVSDRTFNLINDLIDDSFLTGDFILINALAIDMD